MKTLVSSILDIFDKNFLFTGIEVPDGYTFINAFALPSVWGYSDDENEYRSAEISVRCRVIVSLQDIS